MKPGERKNNSTQSHIGEVLDGKLISRCRITKVFSKLCTLSRIYYLKFRKHLLKPPSLFLTSLTSKDERVHLGNLIKECRSQTPPPPPPTHTPAPCRYKTSVTSITIVTFICSSSISYFCPSSQPVKG
jgi:hypothetical protein